MAKPDYNWGGIPFPTHKKRAAIARKRAKLAKKKGK